jgi:glycosyltransferase involved in cell wall biosynthesis
VNIAILDTTNFSNFPIGGQLTSIKYFLKYVNESKYDIEDFTLIGITNEKSDVLGIIRYIEIEDVKIKFLPLAYIETNEDNMNTSLRKTYFTALLRNMNIIKQLNFDIFYIHSIEAFLPILILGYYKKKILFSHGNFYDILPFLRFGRGNKLFKAIFKTYINLILKKADQIFVLDDKTYNDYKKVLKYPSKISIVNNSINHEDFKPNMLKKSEKLNLLYVGRLSKNKSIDKIILSIKELKYEIDCILLIVGAGEEREQLKQIITSNNMGNYVKLVGKKSSEELGRIYNHSDILILNSFTEGSPMVILEAIASGIPVITTRVGNIDRTIKGKYNGEFTNGTAIDIKEKIKKVNDNLINYKINAYESSKKYSYKEVNGSITKKIYDC